MSLPKPETKKLLEVYAHIDENGQYHFLTLPDEQIDEEDLREPGRDWFKGNRLAPAGFRDIEEYDFNNKIWKEQGKRSTARSLRKGKHYENINHCKDSDQRKLYSDTEYHARAWIQARASETYEESVFNPATQKIGGPIGKPLTIVLVDLNKKPEDPNFVVGELFLPWQRSFWPDWHKGSNLKTVNALEYIHNKDLVDTKRALEAIEQLSKVGIDIEKLKRGDEQCEMAARMQLEIWRREALSSSKLEKEADSSHSGILKLELDKQARTSEKAAEFTPLRSAAQSATATASGSDQNPEVRIEVDTALADKDVREARKTDPKAKDR